jgi:hypothetical protein
MLRRAFSVVCCLVVALGLLPSSVRAAAGWSVSPSPTLVKSTLVSSSGSTAVLDLENNVSYKPFGNEALGFALDALGFGGGYSQEVSWGAYSSYVDVSCPAGITDAWTFCSSGGSAIIPDFLRTELNLTAHGSGTRSLQVGVTSRSVAFDLGAAAIGVVLTVLEPSPFPLNEQLVAATALKLIPYASGLVDAVKRRDKKGFETEAKSLVIAAAKLMLDKAAEWGLTGAISAGNPEMLEAKLIIKLAKIDESLFNLDTHLLTDNATTTVTVSYDGSGGGGGGGAGSQWGQFAPTGSMSDTGDVTAAVLSNGKVLVFHRHLTSGGGGLIVSSSTAELYDPQTGTFAPDGHLIVPREGETATALADGTVLVAGGSSDISGQYPLTSAEVFDPRTGTSVATGSMSVGHGAATAVQLKDGRVLVAGGLLATPYNGQCCVESSVASAELYDPRTGVFAATGSMLEPRDSGRGFVLPDGRVLILGGERNVLQGSMDLATAEVFDPSSGRFSATGSMSVARDAPAIAQLSDGRVVVAGGRVYVPAGGNTLRSEPLLSAEIYDPTTSAFVSTHAPAVGRWGTTAVLLGDGKVLVAGGDDHDGDGPYLATAELYDPISGTFTSATSMSVARSGAIGVPLPDGSALILGGYSGSPGQYLTSAELFR